MGLVAAYVGLSALVVSVAPGELGFLWFSSTGIAVLVGLLLAQRAMKTRA
jgi:hypothetical protein